MTRNLYLLYRLIFIEILFLFSTSCVNHNTPSNLKTVPKTISTDSLADNNWQLNYDSHQSRDLVVKYNIEQLDNTNGLSNSSVNDIFQDSENLLWIGTWDGLNRYDGHKFKVFRPELNNKNSLSNQVILKIDEDRSGKIWALTMHGLNRYDKISNSFTRFYFSRKNTPPFTESEFNMTLDQSKNVFCAVKDWGIGYFDGTKFKALKAKNLPNISVKKMDFSPSGKLLLLSDLNVMYCLDIQTNEAGDKFVMKTNEVAKNINDFGTVSHNRLLLKTTSGSTRLINLENKTQYKFQPIEIQDIVTTTTEGLLINDGSSYFFMDSLGNTFTNSWTNHIRDKKITSLIKGTEHIIWTATDGDGLFKMSPIKKEFKLISGKNIPEIDGGIVRVFLEVKGNSFWVGTKGKGLFRLPSKFYKNGIEPLKYQNFNENNSSINNAVFSLYKGDNDLIFIGTDGEGIDIFDLQKSKFISWSELVGSKLCNYFKSTYAIYQDDNGFVWLGTNGYGMIRFKIKRDGTTLKITHFKQFLAASETDGSLSSNIIFSIVPQNEKLLWLGTRLGGLNLFDKKTERFMTFTNTINDPQSLSNNDILCLHKDSNKKLWIGTSLGLNLLEKFEEDQVPKFKKFTVKEGLPNNTIHGIVSDQNSNLWVSTNFGLSHLIYKNSKFYNYTKNEGLQNNEFADGAFYQINSPNLFFMGGIKGFNYFSPSKMIESPLVPNLLIDKISGQNQDLPYYQGLVISPISKTAPSITLKHDQNFFDIELAALTYINSEKCQYSYTLTNFDQQWNTINNRRRISFTNVPKGTYSLWVKWSNSDGVWSRPIRAIDIEIEPVFWQSNLALSIYFICIVLFLLFVWSYYNKQNRLRQTIQFQKREEEIHQNRLTFFTNIAHEFQTPLTLIVGPIQKLSEADHMSDKNKQFIKMVQRNSSRLLFLTQQLLEFRKAEYDHLEVSVKQFDLVHLIEQIAELFDDWAIDKNIEYHLELPPTLIGWFDKDKIEKIIFNLLSNAFKYTPKDGKIVLQFEIKEEEINTLYIEVSNSGKGISREKLNSLFDRFFLTDHGDQKNTNLFRTGIGLAYIRKLVTVLRGDIQVSSHNKMIVFTINIPCSQTSFNPIEFDTEENQILISDHLKNILEEPDPNSEVNKVKTLEGLIEKRKLILIVEDEREIQLFLSELLKDTYKIITADNGIEALSKMKTEIPDLIITDVMMPIMGGIELCEKIKTNDQTCHVPIIMLTAKSTITQRIEGLESGANAYISKPFHPDHILIRVEKLLEERMRILKYLTQDNIIDSINDIPLQNDDKELLRAIIKTVRDHIDNENLHSQFLEEKLGISKSQLYRKIKQNFGFPPGDLIRTIRLKYAAELLRKSNLTVSEICYQSGFNNRSYFYREFKKMYATTPKNYQIKKNSISA